MRALDRKLLRETWQIRTQVVAIALVVACGIGAFVAMSSAWSSLDRARSDFYAQSRFADVFARLVRAPRSVVDSIEALPDVEAVEARVVARVNVDVTGFDEPVHGTIVSLPEHGRPTLNDLHLRRGRWPAPERDDEVLVHEAFAEAHALAPGDSVDAVLNGSLQRLHIVGIALSAEYVYQVLSGSVYPDDERNGVFWMNERALGRAFDLEGAFNDVAVRLGRGAREEPVIAGMDRLLEPFGGVGAHGREEQGSHRMLIEELNGLRTQAVVVTAIFLGVAAFLLQLVLGRIIAGQREIIAVLKALGYRTRTIGAHYLGMVALVCTLGALVGALLGVALGRSMVNTYAAFFRFPSLEFRVDTSVLLIGFGVSLLAGFAATLGSVRRVVRLPPAVAMKPPAPATYRPTLIERLGLGRHLPMAARMVTRRLSRTPVKSVLASVGVALSLGILLATAGMLGALDLLIDVAFREEQHQDAQITFFEPQAEGVVYEVQRLPGVIRVEPTRAVAVRLCSGWKQENLALQGLPADGELRRIISRARREVGLRPAGLLLSRQLGAQLGVAQGDEVLVEVLEGERPTPRARVVGLVDDFVGLNAWVSLDALHEMMGEGRRISGANVRLDPRARQAFLDASEEIPVIAGVQLRTAAIEVFEETVAATQTVTTGILALFASVIAVGVVYNTARITLADSSRELASLRVLGFTRREISHIFLGELAAIVVLALPLGWAAGWALAWLITASMPAELFRLPVRILPVDVLRSVGVVLAAASASALLVRRRLDRLDLIGVLKTRE